MVGALERTDQLGGWVRPGRETDTGDEPVARRAAQQRRRRGVGADTVGPIATVTPPLRPLLLIDGERP